MTKRILVVEDTEDNRQIIRDLMTSAGYELIEAVDGIEGVATAEREKRSEERRVGKECVSLCRSRWSPRPRRRTRRDRKSTRLNSSHVSLSRMPSSA